ncbi:MAG: hypothetical protein JWN48_5421 [Myxococcaceae bacterium]|nr:hypothetical protein [Myxococcaceae bacterium]
MKNGLVTVLLAMLTIVTGCSHIRAAMARDKHMKKAVMEHTYQRPCGEVWAAARTLLFARDYQVQSADGAAGLTLETEWKTEGKGNQVSMSRYLFQGMAPTPESCRVQATQATKDLRGNTDMERDWRMEWDLIKQVDAESAQRIESEAQAAGDEAAKSKG